jgi:hypothetical protein
LPQLLESAATELLPIGRHLAKRLRGSANLLPLFGGQPLEVLVARQDALALLGSLLIKRMQPVDEPLLLVRGQTAETWLAAQRVLLLLRRQILMVVEPLGKMLLPRTAWLYIRVRRQIRA